ncbi:MAG: hypothetical protein IPP38_08760 [Bacteroidetes bacterium]|nr:hypothetical protein [Bacteroidota bacterium]
MHHYERYNLHLPPGGGTDCDLLRISLFQRRDQQWWLHEYPQVNAGTSQSNQGSDDGRLRLTGATQISVMVRLKYAGSANGFAVPTLSPLIPNRILFRWFGSQTSCRTTYLSQKRKYNDFH